MKLKILRPALLAVVAVFAGQAVAQETAPPAGQEATKELKYANKWRIEVKEGANNDGLLRFRLTPQGETPIEITVSLQEGRSENGVANDVKEAFKALLDKKRFHVEGDDFEDVLVKKKGGPDFALELIEDTVKGTHVDLERE